MFDSSIYLKSFQEFNSLTATPSVPPGSTVTIVHATDGDGLATPAGQLEYRIASGAVQLGVEMFSIPNPRVSHIFAILMSMH